MQLLDNGVNLRAQHGTDGRAGEYPELGRLAVAAFLQHILDATGMRIGELEALTWGDVDEPHGRWRIATSKTGRPRWVTPAPILLDRVLDLCPRDDRHPDRRVFEHVTSNRLRSVIFRACIAAGVPAFSPHDLRHRRVSLLHLGGMPWARIGELVGHDDVVTTARVYTHVVADEAELDYAELLA